MRRSLFIAVIFSVSLNAFPSEDALIAYYLSYYYLDEFQKSGACGDSSKAKIALNDAIRFRSEMTIYELDESDELPLLIKDESLVDVSALWLDFKVGILDRDEACKLFVNHLIRDLYFYESKIRNL